LSDDNRFAFSANTAIRVFDNADGKVLSTFWTGKSDSSAATVVRIAARPGTNEVVTADTDMRLVVYDWKSGRYVGELGRHATGYWQDGKVRRWLLTGVTNIKISRDGRYAASIGPDFGVKIWDLQSRRLYRSFNAPSGVSFSEIAFFNGGRSLAAAVNSGSPNKAHRSDVFFFDLEKGLLSTIAFSFVSNLETAANGRDLIVDGSRIEPKTYGIHLFDAERRFVKFYQDRPSSKRIAGERAFDTHEGGLVVRPLEKAERSPPFVGSSGFSALVQKNNSSQIRLIGNAGGIFNFDTQAGSLSLNGKTLDRKKDIPWYVAAYGGENDRLVAELLSDLDDSVWLGGRVHSSDGKPICDFKYSGTPLGRTATIVAFDYSRPLGLVASLFNEDIIIHDANDCSERRRIPLNFVTSSRALVTNPSGPLPTGLRFSADGKTLFAWRAEAGVQSFDPRTGQSKTTYSTALENGLMSSSLSSSVSSIKKRALLPLVYAVFAIPNSNRFAVVTGGNGFVRNAYGGIIQIFEEGNARYIASYDLGAVPAKSSAISADGQKWLTTLDSLGVAAVDVMTGAKLVGIGQQPSSINQLAFSSNGRLMFVLAGDGILRTYSAQSGALLLTSSALSDGGWLSITPEGFFASAGQAERIVRVRRGGELFEIEQVYQSLYRPDLVREKLADDPRGLVREAAEKLELTKVIASGVAPEVKVTLSDQPAANSGVSASAEITDRGGGIGRVEWRVNGITVGVDNPVVSGGQPARLTRTLALDTGNNDIEVVAYNSANLMASLPTRVSRFVQQVSPVTPPAPTATPTPLPAGKPRLFVLAAGTDDYADKRFALQYSVPDARAVAQAFEASGKGLYASIEVKFMSDAEVVNDRLDVAFAEISKLVQPTDVFVLYLAGHGKTVDGRYYFVPQNFRVEGEVTGPKVEAAVKAQGISQDQWQRWLATIPARKSVILFDTCESGTLTDGADETKTLERGAANDRLAQATGRSIITASSGSTEAIEGYRGHGLFTYNLLDALDRGDGDGNGTIEVTELAAYVYAQVIMISEKVFRQRQEPQVKITLDYALTRQAQVLKDSPPAMAVGKPTYQVAQTASVQVKPATGATVVRSLSAKTGVTVVKSEGAWSLIARDGKPIGYVATRELTPCSVGGC
jgi:WD40 repeat protein/uncharacterized caspase-like protein